MYITLCEAKKHLLIDSSFKDDDEYILALIDAAEEAVSINLCVPLDSIAEGGEIPPSVKAAILLLIGNFYANREPVAYTSVNKVPYTYEYLISLNKNYALE